MERRFTSPASPIRIEERSDGGKTIVGYGAVHYRASDAGTEYRPFPDFRERIAAGAFDKALERSDDVRGLFNHDPSALLGRTSARTMRLSVDDVGLRYEIDLPDTQTGRDVAESIRRGDLSGSSFAFSVDEQEWTHEGGNDIRQIRSVTLFDCGPVTYPAYEATTTNLRSADRGELLKSLEKFRSYRSADRLRRRAAAERLAIDASLL